MPRVTLTLHPSEAVVIRAAAKSTRPTSPQVASRRAARRSGCRASPLDEALWLARTGDDMIHSDNEMG